MNKPTTPKTVAPWTAFVEGWKGWTSRQRAALVILGGIGLAIEVGGLAGFGSMLAGRFPPEVAVTLGGLLAWPASILLGIVVLRYSYGPLRRTILRSDIPDMWSEAANNLAILRLRCFLGWLLVRQGHVPANGRAGRVQCLHCDKDLGRDERSASLEPGVANA